MPGYTTLDDVVTGLAALEHEFQAKGDRRAVFATLYLVVSREMRDRVAQRAFLDPAWVHRYAVTFANFYRTALEGYDGGHAPDVPRAWRVCFDAAAAGTGLVLQDMLLGVNAHVNHDLPLALDRVSIDPDRSRRRSDHDAVNAVLASVTERATARLAALSAPGLAGLDDCAGELDEMVSYFSLEVARDHAWESAVALTNARHSIERELTTRFVSSRAALIARLLLTPSRNRTFVAVCRRLEQGLHWPTLLAGGEPAGLGVGL
jgi:hypothetical protein